MALSLSGDGTLSGVDIAASGLGRVLQVVRATDTIRRTTTSSSFADSGISVTITPTKSTSAILLVWSAFIASLGAGSSGEVEITDSSNNDVPGAERISYGVASEDGFTLIGYATPATTSAVTYKGRYRTSTSDTTVLYNDIGTGQLFAIEIGA